jgi:hypothetical protein
MHGQFFTPEYDRFDALRQPRVPRVSWHGYEPVPTNLAFDRVTYTVELFREVRGNAYREMKIAVIDGAKNITNNDRWEIEHDMCQYHWRPWVEPSFLKNFESWFAWCVYRNDNYNCKWLRQEFQRRI